MRIVEIEALPNGAHRNQESDFFTLANLPFGWAVIPDGMVCQNFPFGTMIVENDTVVAWTPSVIPEDPQPTAEELREIAYNTEKCIEWEGEMITVTEAAQLWQYYAAEGSAKADQLTALISAAKSEIRSRIHD